MFDWLDLIPVVLSSGAVVALICQAGSVAREWVQGQAEVDKIRATADADVTRIWATSEAKIAEMRVAHDLQVALEHDRADRPQSQVQRLRPPPDQIDPPAAS